MERKKQIDSEFFKGSIKHKMLPYVERMKAVEETAANLEKEKSTDAEGKEVETYTSASNIEISKRYHELVKPLIVDVDLEIVAEGDFHGTKIKNLDELCQYQEGSALMMGVAGDVLSGLSLGKKKES